MPFWCTGAFDAVRAFGQPAGQSFLPAMVADEQLIFPALPCDEAKKMGG
jgi:hypothetical protein